MKTRYFSMVGCVLLLFSSACVSKKDYEENLKQLEAAKQKIARLEDRVKQRDAKIAALEKRVDEITGKLDKSRGELEALEGKLQEKNKAETKQVEKYRNLIETLRSQNSSIQKQLLEKTKGLSQLQDLLSRKEKSLGELHSLLDQKTSALADLQGRFDKFRMSSTQKLGELANLKEQVSAKDEALKEKENQIQALMKQLEGLKKGGLPGLQGGGGLFKK